MVKAFMKQFNMNSIPRFLHTHLCSQHTNAHRQHTKSRIISLLLFFKHKHELPWALIPFLQWLFWGIGFTTKPWLSWNSLSRHDLPALPPKCWDNSHVALCLAHSQSLKERTLSRDNDVTHRRQWYSVWFTDCSKVSQGWGRNILWAKNWPVYATQQGPLRYQLLQWTHRYWYTEDTTKHNHFYIWL